MQPDYSRRWGTREREHLSLGVAAAGSRRCQARARVFIESLRTFSCPVGVLPTEDGEGTAATLVAEGMRHCGGPGRAPACDDAAARAQRRLVASPQRRVQSVMLHGAGDFTGLACCRRRFENDLPGCHRMFYEPCIIQLIFDDSLQIQSPSCRLLGPKRFSPVQIAYRRRLLTRD